MRNVELKARLHDPARAEEACRQLNARHMGEIHQIDTYYRVSKGRLKLRVNSPGRTELVFYRRDDRPEARLSDYVIQEVSPSLDELLERALGVAARVDKVRTLYLWENVRIHLDRVSGLGTFLEFEAVLEEGQDPEEGRRQVDALQERFGIEPSDLMAQSYLDLVLNAGG